MANRKHTSSSGDGNGALADPFDDMDDDELSELIGRVQDGQEPRSETEARKMARIRAVMAETALVERLLTERGERQMKRCPRCGTTKPVSDFYAHRTGKLAGKPNSYCKPCTASYTAAWAKTNVEANRSKSLRYLARKRTATRGARHSRPGAIRLAHKPHMNRPVVNGESLTIGVSGAHGAVLAQRLEGDADSPSA